MTPFWGYDTEVARWVADHIEGCEEGFGNCRTLGVLEDEKMVAGVVFHNWEPKRGIIEFSGASISKRWLTRPVLWAMFSYPFRGLDCQLVVMRVSANNQQWNGRGLHRLLGAYGFEETRIPRLFGREEDGIVFTLTDDAWKANGFHDRQVTAKSSEV